MTNELKSITKRLDTEILKYFFKDRDLETIFVVGSMADYRYEGRANNDYNIGIICKKFDSNKINNFQKYLKELCEKIKNEKYSFLIGPTNHVLTKDKDNILIHAMLYTKEIMDNYLPNTHKYQYGNNYRIVYGKDYLREYKNVKYNLNNIVYDYEGLNYCIDMLKKKEYRYLEWDVKNDKCNFDYHAIPMDDKMIIEICCYSVNKFINNLMNYCKWEGLDIPDNKMIFTIRLLGQSNVNENTLFLLQGLFNKSDTILNLLFANPLKETIKILENLKFYMNYLETIFPYKKTKRKKLIRF